MAIIFGSNMHKIVQRLGLRPKPYWGSSQCSPNLLAGKGEGKGGEGEGRGREQEGERREVGEVASS